MKLEGRGGETSKTTPAVNQGRGSDRKITRRGKKEASAARTTSHAREGGRGGEGVVYNGPRSIVKQAQNDVAKERRSRSYGPKARNPMIV